MFTTSKNVRQRPEHYPHTPNSGIYDAGAFRIGSSSTTHRAHSFPNATTVTARCGAVARCGYDVINRAAEWSASEVDCVTCLER